MLYKKNQKIYVGGRVSRHFSYKIPPPLSLSLSLSLSPSLSFGKPDPGSITPPLPRKSEIAEDERGNVKRLVGIIIFVWFASHS